MDPLTQGALGAALPQATLRHKANCMMAGFLGFLSGMAADLDSLIRSDTDSLLYLEYHRQFTHSLIFMPVGGIICALVLYLIFGKKWRLSFKQTVLYCTLGYLTHALLDAATSYGTQLFWPFNDMRIAWNVISVIDPLFSVPLGLCVLFAAVKSSRIAARIGLAWCAVYLIFAITQHHAAKDLAYDLAASRGHQAQRLTVKPSFGNTLVWKSIYEADGEFYVDAVRPLLAPHVIKGRSLPTLNLARDYPWLEKSSQQAIDIARFSHFSDGYVSVHPDDPARIIDVRYSLVPNEVNPLWSILLDREAGPKTHATYKTHREDAPNQMALLWAMITNGR